MHNTQKVKDFIAAWEARDAENILAQLAPDAIYHNIPMQELKGHDAIRTFITPFLAGAARVAWTVHHMAQSADGVVLTERTDVFEMGPKTISIRVMGTFEFGPDGLITAWRDYFDLGQFQSQMT